MSFEMSVNYGNGVTDKHRSIFVWPSRPIISTTPVDYFAPLPGEPASILSVSNFLDYWWQNVSAYLPTAYTLYRVFLRERAVDDTLGIDEIEQPLGTGWVGQTATGANSRQAGGYHCFTLRAANGRANRQFVFGSSLGASPVHTRDDFHTTRHLNILKASGCLMSYKKPSSGKNAGHGLEPVSSISPYISCGFNKRLRKHNIF